jgi:hypothetical protein
MEVRVETKEKNQSGEPGNDPDQTRYAKKPKASFQSVEPGHIRGHGKGTEPSFKVDRPLRRAMLISAAFAAKF